MKGSDTFQLSYAWWSQARPREMKSTGLGQALRDYEAAKAQLTGLPNDPEIRNAKDALDSAMASYLAPLDSKLPADKAAAFERTRRMQVDRARGASFQLAKAKLDELESTAARARTALKKVEEARMRALCFCTGLLFPDTKKVLLRGAAAVSAETTALKDSVDSVLAKLMDPMVDAVARDMAEVISRDGVSSQIKARIPLSGSRVGSGPKDPRQGGFEKVCREADASLNTLKSAINSLGDSLAAARKSILLAKQNPARHQASLDLFDRADAIRAKAQANKLALGTILDDWGAALSVANPEFEDKKKRDQ